MVTIKRKSKGEIVVFKIDGKSIIIDLKDKIDKHLRRVNYKKLSSLSGR